MERTFNICWGGVYLCTRAFLPLLRAADEAHIVNTSSINGFWASVGPDVPAHLILGGEIRSKGLHRGFDRGFPHRRPAHQGLGRYAGSHRHWHSCQFPKGAGEHHSDELDAAQIGMARARIQSMGKDCTAISDAEIKTMR